MEKLRDIRAKKLEKEKSNDTSNEPNNLQYLKYKVICIMSFTEVDS